jgi:hypothetical protein
MQPDIAIGLHDPALCGRIIFAENRFSLFGTML